MSEEITKILEERKATHGDFKSQAYVADSLKRVMHATTNWQVMDAFKRESLELIATKIARILTGNSNHRDSWVDISGYAELVAKELK